MEKREEIERAYTILKTSGGAFQAFRKIMEAEVEASVSVLKIAKDLDEIRRAQGVISTLERIVKNAEKA